MKNAIKVFCFVIAVIIIGTAGTYFYFTWDRGEFETVESSEKGTVMIKGYIGEDTDVVIPKRLRGKKVIGIDNSAFEKTEITSVEIGGNVKSIGQNAFCDCKSLKSVKLNEGVVSLGESAFFGCEALESVEIPSTLEKINDAVFINTALKDIDFSKNDYFIIEDGVVYSKDKTTLLFTLGSADLSAYVLPETVNSINAYAFYNHSELKSIKLNDGIKKIYNAVFFGCKGLTELRLPSSVVSVDSLIISDSGIKKIYITDGTKNINKLAFKGMEEQLTIVTEKNSEAAKFAEENKFKLEIADSI